MHQESSELQNEKEYPEDSINDYYQQLDIDTPSSSHLQTFNLEKINIQIIRNEPSLSLQASIELLENISLQDIVQKSQLKLPELLNKVQTEANLFLQGYQILLYLYEGQLYVNFGVHPFTSNVSISLHQFMEASTQTIRMKLQKVQWSLSHIEMIKNTSQFLLEGPPRKISTKQNQQLPKKSSSIKNFQKVGYIVSVIMSLRKNKNKHHRKQHKILKNNRHLTSKSEQDYYYQIKKGYLHGYNFNENCQQNLKHLRDYVKRMELSKEKKRSGDKQNLRRQQHL